MTAVIRETDRGGLAVDTRPLKITAAHLARAAYVYVRQSTLTQVHENVESQQLQYGLAEHARAYGWHRVEVIDEDLGRSGAGRIARPGFERLVSAVCLETVGAVFAIDVSRFARNSRDWAHLVDLCGLTGTLIIDGQGIYDPRDMNDRLLLGLKGTMSEWELSVMRERSLAALQQKAERGALYTTVPIGFLRTRDDRVELDPDLRIQQAIRLIFRQFAATGSVRQTLLWFRQEGIDVPAVEYGPFGRAVVWKLPVYNTIHKVLTNPMYAGVYAFGRTTTRTTVRGGHAEKRHGIKVDQDQWRVLLTEHHAGYISWTEFQTHQRQITENAQMKGIMSGTSRGAPRKGIAVLAGLFRCRRCGRRLYVAYSGVGGLVRRYSCHGAAVNHGTDTCLSFGGLAVERAVEEALLAVMQPGALEAACTTAAQADAQQADAQQADARAHVALKVEQARYEAERARRQYDVVDPANRLVAAELERRWNLALTALTQAEQAMDEFDAGQIAAPVMDRDRLMTLAVDLPRVWHDPHTDLRLKKRIIRLLIEEILVDVSADGTRIEGVIRWAGGQHSTLSVRKRKTGENRHCTDRDVIDVVRELALVLTDAKIALVLNRLGYTTGRGNTWIASRVVGLRNHHDIPVFNAERAAREGTLTMELAAARAGVSPTVIRTLIERGMLPAKQVVPHAPWVIRAADMDSDGVVRYLHQVRTGRSHPRTAHPAQLSLDTSTPS